MGDSSQRQQPAMVHTTWLLSNNLLSVFHSCPGMWKDCDHHVCVCVCVRIYECVCTHSWWCRAERSCRSWRHWWVSPLSSKPHQGCFSRLPRHPRDSLPQGKRCLPGGREREVVRWLYTVKLKWYGTHDTVPSNQPVFPALILAMKNMLSNYTIPNYPNILFSQ